MQKKLSEMTRVERTKYWKDKLRKLLEEYNSETGSKVSKNILENFKKEVENFKQICPIEMLDKLENPISLKKEKHSSLVSQQ